MPGCDVRAAKFPRQELPPGQIRFGARPDVQLARGGEILVLRFHGVLAVAWVVPVQQRLGVVGTGQGQFLRKSDLPAECQRVFELADRRVRISHQQRRSPR